MGFCFVSFCEVVGHVKVFAFGGVRGRLEEMIPGMNLEMVGQSSHSHDYTVSVIALKTKKLSDVLLCSIIPSTSKPNSIGVSDTSQHTLARNAMSYPPTLPPKNSSHKR